MVACRGEGTCFGHCLHLHFLSDVPFLGVIITGMRSGFCTFHSPGQGTAHGAPIRAWVTVLVPGVLHAFLVVFTKGMLSFRFVHYVGYSPAQGEARGAPISAWVTIYCADIFGP